VVLMLQISKKYTHYAAIILFLYFGLRMLFEAGFGGDSVRSQPSP
jgi:putative Ca2+/H+ antiporter (TMEM165/GDT1 family)